MQAFLAANEGFLPSFAPAKFRIDIICCSRDAFIIIVDGGGEGDVRSRNVALI